MTFERETEELLSSVHYTDGYISEHNKILRAGGGNLGTLTISPSDREISTRYFSYFLDNPQKPGWGYFDNLCYLASKLQYPRELQEFVNETTMDEKEALATSERAKNLLESHKVGRLILRAKCPEFHDFVRGTQHGYTNLTEQEKQLVLDEDKRMKDNLVLCGIPRDEVMNNVTHYDVPGFGSSEHFMSGFNFACENKSRMDRKHHCGFKEDDIHEAAEDYMQDENILKAGGVFGRGKVEIRRSGVSGAFRDGVCYAYNNKKRLTGVR